MRGSLPRCSPWHLIRILSWCRRVHVLKLVRSIDPSQWRSLRPLFHSHFLERESSKSPRMVSTALMASHAAMAGQWRSPQHLHRRSDAVCIRRRQTRCCASPPPQPLHPSNLVSRRAAAASLIAFNFYFCSENRADAGGPFDKYLKKKKLDPLETYVPAVLLTQAQFKDLETVLSLEKPEYDVSRSLLRSGPAGSLRINIRAVAQYASEDGKGKSATDAVDQCLRALEDLDSMLLRASRNDPSASVVMMRQKINTALLALDMLLETVPSAVLDKGKLIADSYRTQIDPAEQSQPDIEQLRSLL